MNALKLSLALAASLAPTVWASAQSSYTVIPGAFFAMDVTPDGRIVVGEGPGGGYYWNWQVDPTPTSIGGFRATGISADGTAICGDIADPMTGAEIAARWTQATGWVSIGALPNAQQCPSLSSAYDISADGTVIVGLSWDGCDGRAFKWQLGIGMIPLEVLGNGANRASAIADDGSLIGGFAQSNSRTPSVWVAAGTGTLFDPNVSGEVYGVSANGARIFGQWNGQPFYKDGNGPAVILPSGVPGNAGQATDGSAAGDRIVGFDSQFLSQNAWVWEASSNTTTLLRTALLNQGVGSLPAQIGVATACSADGRIIVGHTNFGGGAYVAVLEGCNAGASSFCSTAPNSASAGGALIDAVGSFDISNNDTVLSASPVPNQPGLFYFGASQVNGGSGVPFGNGIRCVTGSQVYRLPVVTGAFNVMSYALDLTLPPASATITAGSTWYFQAWFRDPAAGGATFNLSDAVAITFCD